MNFLSSTARTHAHIIKSSLPQISLFTPQSNPIFLEDFLFIMLLTFFLLINLLSYIHSLKIFYLCAFMLN
jgi:hypothetical protein